MPVLTEPTQLVVRRLRRADSISRLTLLYHRAYARQVRLGLRPLAGRQDESMTRARAALGECYVAERDGVLVGAIVLNERERVDFPPLFLEPDVSHFSMFAVDPRVQGAGIGVALLDAIERRTIELGHTRLAMSVAEPDRALVRFYENRGFGVVEYWTWGYTNYSSAIMCKPIG